jgi:purine-nucleoside phosphorylase
MPTPHIDAAPGAFAETVLMPGDPLRARAIAERFFEDAEQVCGLRNMLGFTGRFRGRRVSVMGSGMGIPSCSLYATELIEHYGVRRLVRVGTCGAVAESLRLGDLVLALGAGTDSNVNRLRLGGHDFPATASWSLLRAIDEAARRRGQPLAVGNVFSTDLFYSPEADLVPRLARMGLLAVEMEAAGLYGVAAGRGAEAAALLAVSDHLVRGERMDPLRREQGLESMLELALEGSLA